MPLPKDPPPELPIWKGRRGMINAAVCCILAVPLAFALWMYTDRSTIAPGCTAYGRVHGMTYTDFKTYTGRRDSNIGCTFKQANGQEAEVPFNQVASYFTKVWVDLAMALEFTIPVFAVLLGLARAHIYMLGARRKDGA